MALFLSSIPVPIRVFWGKEVQPEHCALCGMLLEIFPSCLMKGEFSNQNWHPYGLIAPNQKADSSVEECFGPFPSSNIFLLSLHMPYGTEFPQRSRWPLILLAFVGFWELYIHSDFRDRQLGVLCRWCDFVLKVIDELICHAFILLWWF